MELRNSERLNLKVGIAIEMTKFDKKSTKKLGIEIWAKIEIIFI